MVSAKKEDVEMISICEYMLGRLIKLNIIFRKILKIVIEKTFFFIFWILILASAEKKILKWDLHVNISWED